MTILKSVKEIKDSHLLLLGVVEEGEFASYTVTAAVYTELGCPEAGDVLDSDCVAGIRYADELYRARKKALSLLAFADNNRRTLYAKLCRAGFRRDIAETVLQEMVECGYINERRQLERLILDEANRKLRGPLRIIPALATKGYATSDIREVMAGLVDSGEIDFDLNARRLLDKKLPSDGFDSEEAKKILYKNGYKIC